MKLVKFLTDFFHDGRIKYFAGQHYVPHPEMALEVKNGAAEEVEGDASLAVPPFHDTKWTSTRIGQIDGMIKGLEAERATLVALLPNPASSAAEAQSAADAATAAATADPSKPDSPIQPAAGEPSSGSSAASPGGTASSETSTEGAGTATGESDPKPPAA